MSVLLVGWPRKKKKGRGGRKRENEMGSMSFPDDAIY